MLDFRFKTFLTLCKIKNYTKTAEELHITQPAVSQHIKYLEEYYGSKLFNYQGRSLELTKEGEMLKSFAMTMQSSSNRIKMMISDINSAYPITFGVTLIIAEYTMEPLISKIIEDHPNADITMEVENTKVLLERLRDGKIDFAIVEGHFDKSQYNSNIFSTERFIAVSSSQNDIYKENLEFVDIFDKRLILREKGSGTRDIFEQTLYEHNLTINNFKNISNIGNMNIIKELVKKNLGITFLYEQAVRKELKSGELREILINNFDVRREFNFIFLKNSVHETEYLRWFKYLKNIKDNLSNEI